MLYDATVVVSKANTNQSVNEVDCDLMFYHYAGRNDGEIQPVPAHPGATAGGDEEVS